MVEIAALEGADAVFHGATGKGNDQVRFELTVMALNPKLKIIAPWREWAHPQPRRCTQILRRPQRAGHCDFEVHLHRDRNIWHLSHEGGGLEDPWHEPTDDMFQLTNNVEQAPNEPEYVEIYFESGVPKRVNGVAMGPIDLVTTLNKVGGKHGVGRIDLVENRLVGMKSRGVL